MISDGVHYQITQATSKQMSKRDPLRPYMNIIDNMLHQMVRITTVYTNRSFTFYYSYHC